MPVDAPVKTGVPLFSVVAMTGSLGSWSSPLLNQASSSFRKGRRTGFAPTFYRLALPLGDCDRACIADRRGCKSREPAVVLLSIVQNELAGIVVVGRLHVAGSPGACEGLRVGSSGSRSDNRGGNQNLGDAVHGSLLLFEQRSVAVTFEIRPGSARDNPERFERIFRSSRTMRKSA